MGLDRYRTAIPVGNQGAHLSLPIDVTVLDQRPTAIAVTAHILEVHIAHMMPDRGVSVRIGDIPADLRICRIPVHRKRPVRNALNQLCRGRACVRPVAFLRLDRQACIAGGGGLGSMAEHIDNAIGRRTTWNPGAMEAEDNELGSANVPGKVERLRKKVFHMIVKHHPRIVPGAVKPRIHPTEI